jgi:DNA polymerase elongation subunit (family B)
VANRYFGLFEAGELKLRGIEVRRHDTLPWIRQAEEDMLAILAQARNASEYRVRLEEVLAQARVLMARLRSGQVPISQLLITNRLSRKPSEYRVNLPVALAARDLETHGVPLAAGEQIEYVLTPHGGARPYECWSEADGYDVERYSELLIRMLETLAVPAGLGRKEILEHIDGRHQPELIDSRVGQVQLTLGRAARANRALPEPLALENGC